MWYRECTRNARLTLSLFTRFISQETLDDLFPEESTDDVRIAHGEGILPVFLGNRG
jgi:hypothetical protein